MTHPDRHGAARGPMARCAAALLLALAPELSAAACGTPTVALSEDTLFIGHSLVGFDVPALTQGFVAQAGGTGESDAHIVNGAPLRWSWDNAETAQGVNAREALPAEGYGAVVMTEAIPLRNNVLWNDSAGYAGLFRDLAVEANPDAQVFLYETWHDLRSGTGEEIPGDEEDHIPWRERIDRDRPMWDGIVEGVNAASGADAPRMRLIPAGEAMGRLSDAIDADQAGELASMGEVFTDGIHLGAPGMYLVALVHAGAIYGIDPRGMPPRMEAAWGARVEVSPEAAERMQRIAAETLEANGFLDAGC